MKILIACLASLMVVGIVHAQPTEHDLYEREVASLKTKLHDAERDKTDLTNQLALASAKAQILTNQLAQAVSEETDLKTQLTNLNAQLADANDRIAKMAPLAEKAVQVPVKIGRRNGFTGIVYRFSNLSGKQIRLTVTFQNGPAQRAFSFVADPIFPKEIGKLEGWAGAAGDTVTVQSAGYDPITQNF